MAVVESAPALQTDLHKKLVMVDEVPVDSANASIDGSEEESEDTPLTVDHLIRITAASEAGNEPLVAYPDNGTDYTMYSIKQLDQLIERAAGHYATLIPQRVTSQEPVQTVGLLGQSDLGYLAAMLAVSRLGHTALLLSTRITDEAHESLLRTTNATFLLYGDAFVNTANLMESILPTIQTLRIEDPRHMETTQRLKRSRLDLRVETERLSFIIHSSGSTGLPKPIPQTHKACLYNYSANFGLAGYCTLPLYHNHGISCLFRSVYSRKRIYLYSARSALTNANLVNTLREHKDIKILYAVPYALKLLSESDEGVSLLTRLDIVMFGGSACPKPIGDELVNRGVNLVGHYGATEVGQLMTSFRDHKTDAGWDWLRVPKTLEPFLSMEPRGHGVYELCVKNGWPAKVVSNRSDGSYATKDLFEPHQTIPNAWKYYARLDDTITLENGEKANPLLIEGTMRQNRHVAEVVVFGVGKPRLGAIVIPATTSDLADSAILQNLSPAIEKLNDSLPAYSQLSADMIIVLPRDTIYRQTDKGTVIRAAFYRDHADHIERAYREENNGTLVLQYAELVSYLEKQVQLRVKRLSGVSIDPDVDLFSLGIDSLQSLQIRATIAKEVDIGSNTLATNFVFDFPTLSRAANELIRLRTGKSEGIQTSVEEDMQAMIEKYSVFMPHRPGSSEAKGEYIVITGATGSLGAHTVAQLAVQSYVSQIYCLVRATDQLTASQRVRESLCKRSVYHTLNTVARNKIVAMPSSCFGQSMCGLSTENYSTLVSKTTHVLHLAWSVNFNKTLKSFENDCVAGTRNLINLCLASERPQPASFYFCSSVSATAATPGGTVAEALPSSLRSAQGMGYAQSKLVTEHICLRAAEATGMKVQVLRTGQIIGDSIHGIWNATEAIPLMLQTAKTVGALPQLEETPAWLPVDTVALGIIDIVRSDAESGIMNIVNHKSFSWTDDLLPLLRAAGLKFESVPQQEWVRRLRESDPNPVRNPPIKLLDFFASKYDTDKKRRSLAYSTERCRQASPYLDNANTIDLALVQKIVAQFESSAWSTKEAGPLVVVLGGPCGSGKSTVATKLARTLQLPYIEGDDLHSETARKLMSKHLPLGDQDRQLWLSHVRGAIMDRLMTTKAKAVIVTCSALKTAYRDQLRLLQELVGARVRFIMLSTPSSDILRERVELRKDHYMSPVMVDEQVSILQQPQPCEVDMVPVEAGNDVDTVYEEVRSIVADALKV